MRNDLVPRQRTIWLRGLWMVVMGLTCQLAGTEGAHLQQ